jgi:hypothetical protein
VNTLQEITLTPEEQELFDMFTAMIDDNKLGTTVRVAGGWVRDKLLGARGKEDIDVALDNLSGVEFAQALSEWNEKKGGGGIKFGVIQQNPEKSKHLETATATLGKYQIDFVNLRTEKYTDTRIPMIEIGTPQEDADRRDLTINALFYNVNLRKVEDFTGRGLQDLTSGLAKTPLEALTTLKDDPLRAMRAVRFSCRFGLSMAPDLVAACQDRDVHEALRDKVSRERIFVETEQMMQHKTGAARAVFLLSRLDLMKHVLSLTADAEEETEQAFFAPAARLQEGCAVKLRSEDDISEVKIELAEIEDSYHAYGTCVAAALAVYGRSVGITHDDETSLDDDAHLRGLLNFAALSMYGATLSCLKPGKQNRVQKYGVPRQPLNHLVLQRLKMRVKDVDTIEAMQEAAMVFVPMLRRIALAIDADNEDGTCLTDEHGLQVSFKGISRLELGLALREAGPLREHALRLAVAAMFVEAIGLHTAELSAMRRLISDSAFGESDVSQSSFRTAYGSSLPPLESLLTALGPGPAADSMQSISHAAEDLRDAVASMNLDQIHKEVPTFNGKDLKKVRFPMMINRFACLLSFSQLLTIVLPFYHFIHICCPAK